MLTPAVQAAYVSILREELVMATGCTEPISIAYCAAKLREVLGAVPDRVLGQVSGNILKNAKSVTVPSTGGLKGIKAAIAAGIVAGDPSRELQVIASLPKERHPEIAAYLENTEIAIECPDTPRLLDIRLTGWQGGHRAVVHIANNHSNIVYIEKDGQALLEKPLSSSPEDGLTDKSVLNLRDILAFAREADLSQVSDLLDNQIRCNTAIAEEGLRNGWGAGVGATILKSGCGDAKTEARAWAAAGSDARMSGCEMPVVIVSGSGNQGMTASLPVIRFAERLHAGRDQLYRALLVSNLVTIYQKAGVGRLSAYCGAVSAGVGAGAGIAFLHGADYDEIAHTVTNALAMISGTICDGAKPSCAAKIAASVEAGVLAFQMVQSGRTFHGGDGILAETADKTIANIGVLAKEGMQGTDRTILRLMTQ